jgi:uncharacterized protein
MHGRWLQAELVKSLRHFPAVALLGPRQCGKTTLAKALVSQLPGAIYLDLERPSDRRRLSDPELYFRSLRSAGLTPLVCLDEVQRTPEIFSVLRSVLDETAGPGQLLILGSASPDLLRQSSESLAGRLAYLELTPFLAGEVSLETAADLDRYWHRGGFPRSFLAANQAASRTWRESFVRTFLERDVAQLGFDLPSESLRRLWTMLAHLHGQILNTSRLGAALGVSHTTARRYVDILVGTYMVRLLPPLEANLGKRLVKSPKVYLRDTGILHSLLEIDDQEALLGHPIRGASWEGLAIENAIAAHPGWSPHFYRTSNGAEIDLVLTRGGRRLAFECKASVAPDVTAGFWNALEDLRPDETTIISPILGEGYPLKKGVRVVGLGA